MEIKRYNIFANSNTPICGYHEQDKEGDWVKYSDVEKLIRDAHANVPTAWVDVKTKLPEDYEPVIVYQELEGVTADVAYARWGGELCFIYHYGDDYSERRLTSVTHWMPLPPPPRSVENS